MITHRDFQNIVAMQNSSKGIRLSHETIYSHSTKLGQSVRSSLAKGDYTTVVDVPTVACAEKLPWWQQHHWRWQAQLRQRHSMMQP
jgi:hypothetical protein